MDNSSIMAKEKLGFAGILREALSISTASARFLTLAFLASFPLFCSLLLSDFLLQQTFLNTVHFAFDKTSACSTSGDFIRCTMVNPIDVLKKRVGEASRGLALMSALYLVVVCPLDLINTMMFVHNASAICGGKNLPNLREFFSRTLKKIDFRGPLVTFIYALLLSCLTLLGLLSLASNIYGSPVEFIRVSSSVLFVALFTKYMEWSAIWNMGIVISVLEEKHGDIALGVAAYLSRGSRRKGLALMLVFFIWRLALRLSCLYFAPYSDANGFVAATVQVCLMCLGNVMTWSAFTVYYYDCKKRFLEKKIDVEEGKAAPLVKT